MERIYLSCTGEKNHEDLISVQVFLKDVEETHKTALKTFLINQNISVSPLREDPDGIYSVERSYFDDGFEISYSPKRWQFYAMRDYIYTYLSSWETDFAFASNHFKKTDSNKSEIIFSEKFYVDLSRLIDNIEDKYYLTNRSIAIFLNGILKIFKENLQLYFASAVLKDYNTGKIEYLNYTPENISKDKITDTINHHLPDEILKYPLVFNNEHIADFYFHISPYSPEISVINEFTEYLLAMIDDFIYSDILFRKETFELKSRIAELEKLLPAKFKKLNIEDSGTDDQPLEKSRVRLILIGASEINEGKILSTIIKAGFDKKKIHLYTDYQKFKSIDINNLKKIRSRYDGILLGPMPHKMHGDMQGESLIGIMRNNPEEYPPFTVITDKAKKMKISKSSLKHALEELEKKLKLVNTYTDAI